MMNILQTIQNFLDRQALHQAVSSVTTDFLVDGQTIYVRQRKDISAVQDKLKSSEREFVRQASVVYAVTIRCS